MPVIQIAEEKLRIKYEAAFKREGRDLSRVAKAIGHSRPTCLKWSRRFGLWPKSRINVWEFKKQAA